MPSHWEQRGILAFLTCALICLICFSPSFRFVYTLPPHLRVMEGEVATFQVDFPVTIHFEEKQEPVQTVLLETPFFGKKQLEFDLFGIIPLRTVEVEVMPALKLMPGGHSIGVVLHSQGVIVVGMSPVTESEGKVSTPAKEADIQVGDVLLSLNGIPLDSDSQLAEIIDRQGQEGKELTFLVKRGTEKLQRTLHAIHCQETGRQRIGLFVRDSAAGVGTLTYFDPNSRIYGALGHIITDSDTNQPIDCEQGKIVSAGVSGIQQGKRGHPGEKIGVFVNEEHRLGDIRKNTPFGINGRLTEVLSQPLCPEPLPVGSMNQVHTGPAEIYTVVDGQNIESFAIEIEKINLQEYPEGKGLVIRVTDARLLEKTGGIVQGMSGSPIIQNGYLIGAVTHVFVHDPTKGYGCFIDWMLMDSELVPKKERKNQSCFSLKSEKQDFFFFRSLFS